MTPYRYFADKDAMLAAVRARAFDRFAEAMEATYDRFPLDAEPSAEAANPYLDYALGHPAAYRRMFDINQLTATRHRTWSAPWAGRGPRWRAIYGQPGPFETDDIDLVSPAFWSAMHGPIMAGAGEPAGERGDRATPDPDRLAGLEAWLDRPAENLRTVAGR
jgi:AcrR family transcriptional regulator